MRLCCKRCIQAKERQEEQIVFNSCSEPRILFLDDIRIGLRLRPFLLQVEVDVIDLSMIDHLDNVVIVKKIPLEKAQLAPGTHYIGITQEEFRLPDNMLGWIYTRSKYARVGFNALTSSQIVIPGYGQRKPTPLVLELSVAFPTVGLRADNVYAFLLLFELDRSILARDKDYWKRFPFNSNLVEL